MKKTNTKGKVTPRPSPPRRKGPVTPRPTPTRPSPTNRKK